MAWLAVRLPQCITLEMPELELSCSRQPLQSLLLPHAQCLQLPWQDPLHNSTLCVLALSLSLKIVRAEICLPHVRGSILRTLLAAQDGTRAIACIFMPFVQLRVMDVISAALTPSGPPICTSMLYYVTMQGCGKTWHGCS